MVNKNYVNGRSREYRIMKNLKKAGMICLRCRGSHGIADIIAINPQEKIINLIQVKPKSLSCKQKDKIEEKFDWANDLYSVKFKVVSLSSEIL